MVNSQTFGWTCGVLILLTYSCQHTVPSNLEHVWSSLPDRIDYNFHVRPILSDRCFACHGPDRETQEAELRLDQPEGAYAALASGDGHAIVPGKVDESMLATRILSNDAEIQMPPPESNLILDDREKAILIKWIDQGAKYKEHWAFTTPTKPKLPKVKNSWGVSEIDQFILAKLEAEGVTPSPEADDATLIRRLYFDLTGLPPSLSELDQINLKEDSYEQLADSLLARTSYGERMASYWLDVARFADSEGYLDDFHHTFWPYRDWVINAYNRNLSYDKFILWQLGGDQMPDATQEQRLATAFNRNHKQNSEGGIIPEEFRVDYVADRTNTVGTAFLGLTVGCARCHDHKYDPFSQKNYYELFAFFNSTIERGDGIFSYNATENGRKIPNHLSMNSGPVLAISNPEIDAIREFLQDSIDRLDAKLTMLESTPTPASQRWATSSSTGTLEMVVDEATRVHLPFDHNHKGISKDIARGSRDATYRDLEFVPGVTGQAIRSDAHGQLVADGSRVGFERTEPFTISFWIRTPKAFDEAHVLYNGNNRIQGYRGWDVMINDNHLYFRLNHAHPYQSISVYTANPLPINEWTHFVWTYDGSSKAEGVTIYQDGQEINAQIERDYLYRSTKPYTDTKATVYMPYQGMIIGNRHYDQDFTGGLLDEIRIMAVEADATIASYLFDKDQGRQEFTAMANADPVASATFFNRYLDDENLADDRQLLAELRQREVVTIDTLQELMIMGDWQEERPTYVLDRGVYDAHGEPVERNVPNEIMPWPEDLPKNRYGLGLWLTHPDHPLTSRVAVNQIWYLLFGEGLVTTVEDFGSQGALPSHPELLDWLAVDFREHGWDVKRLIKQIVMSSTYRQSSVIRPELQEIDPDNVLLARAPRYRRSAEMVRDNLLASSGLLDKKIGGTSAFPYQPPDLWAEASTHQFMPEYAADHENGLYRRSLYTFWKRNMPPPSMLIFDASERAECVVRRPRSNTPLQALVMLNDPQVIEACRALATHTLLEEENLGDQLVATFTKLTGRAPSSTELDILKEQLQAESQYFENAPDAREKYLTIGKFNVLPDLDRNMVAALSRVANTIANSTEGYYKN